MSNYYDWKERHREHCITDCTPSHVRLYSKSAPNVTFKAKVRRRTNIRDCCPPQICGVTYSDSSLGFWYTLLPAGRKSPLHWSTVILPVVVTDFSNRQILYDCLSRIFQSTDFNFWPISSITNYDNELSGSLSLRFLQQLRCNYCTVPEFHDLNVLPDKRQCCNLVT